MDIIYSELFVRLIRILVTNIFFKKISCVLKQEKRVVKIHIK